MRRFVGLALLMLAAPRAGAAQRASDPASRTPPAAASPAVVAYDSATRDSIARLSRAQVGARYRLGAERPGAFDCSGLVRYVLAAVGVVLPRTAAEQARLGVAVARDTAQLLPGDILTFGRGRRITHVGIYVGDGRYVHASSRKRRVVEVSLESLTGRWARWWRGARRVLPSADTLPAPEERPAVGPVISGL
jgi:cell wall-associated NlpC family hydrolase